MSFTLYDILGVSSKANSEDIKAAYKKLAKKYHPDKNQGSKWHEEQFKRINQVYQILSDPITRRQYDSKLEFENYQRQNPTSKPKPAPTPTYQKPEQKKQAPQYNRNPSPNYKKKKKYEITISNRRLNLLVVGYYVVAIFLLAAFYEFKDFLQKEDYISEGIRFEKEGEYHYAVTAYSQALKFDPKNAEAFERRGIARLKIPFGHELANALSDFSDAILLTDNPSDSLLYKRAKCLFLLKQYSLAIPDFDKIIADKNSKLDSVYFYRAESNFHIGNYKNAIPDYTNFISLEPISGEAHYHRGLSYFKNKDYRRAYPDFDYAISWQPENGRHHYYRGIINFALKDTSNGCIDLTNAFLLGDTESSIEKDKYCN